VRRLLIRVALVAFLAFEATRAVALGQLLLPEWRNVAGDAQAMLALPWWAAIPATLIAVAAFVIPMAAVMFGLRRLHLRLFRNRTVG